VIETAQQIMKDFGLFGIEITFSAPVDEAYQELHSQLVYQIERLYVNDYSRLLSVLYQVDITDKQIARSAEELPQYSAVEVIAHEVIVRDLKKVLLRRYFKNQQ
jgi:hypothetical protein